MTVDAGLQPLRDLVLVERVREVQSKGGIWIPQTFEGTNSQKLNAKRDYWRARVIAVGPEAYDLEPGDEVLVHTWADENGKGLYTGVNAGRGLMLVSAEKDIICAVEPDPVGEPGSAEVAA